MLQILSSICASISELKKSPTALLEEAKGMPIAILNHNKPTAYLIDAETYEDILDRLDDIELAKIVKERENDDLVKVSIDEL